jgi:hypothetical protein
MIDLNMCDHEGWEVSFVLLFCVAGRLRNTIVPKNGRLPSSTASLSPELSGMKFENLRAGILGALQ